MREYYSICSAEGKKRERHAKLAPKKIRQPGTVPMVFAGFLPSSD
jgi:hypothetical protein